MRKFTKWYQSGAPWVWLSAGAVSICLLMVFGILLLIVMRGMGYFWPGELVQLTYRDGAQETVLVGEFQEHEQVPAAQLRAAGIELPAEQKTVQRHLFKVGNRDVLGQDFRWLLDTHITAKHYPAELVVLERREWGNFYGYLKAIKRDGNVVAEGEAAYRELSGRLDGALKLHGEIRTIEKQQIGAINYSLERLRLDRRVLELEGEDTPEALAELEQERLALEERYKTLQTSLVTLYQESKHDGVVMQDANGQEKEILLSQVVRVYQPNAMSVIDKCRHYLTKVWEFVTDEPREANTEGGIFPAIFGTVVMVMIMTVFVTPLGVIAAVYLREYARQGALTRTVRIAVNNLAGVPSIVYGVFGLGFFVYFLGGSIDQLFFPEALPAPTFGTPGLLWSSLTLALLTLPVVIVATEEGLSRIPRSVREGSLALGATKAETLWRIVLPMASPALMTGLILAVARAAGEVAPLMLVGVVKLAPALPLDMNAPYLHLDRKLMHLGFHVFDVGFQSPNVEAARPLVYATALLLVVVIVVLNLLAIYIRNRLREKYRTLEG
ncbi:MAG: phosphate ABC transporter, permease protein PstA [Gammaproteobacteria bacterium RBG_16_57_12]|nr:MAG: phosphate ABC transporter, permease protein PstA [Gammaproteobacteria bacterium RBG_16_57_12]